MAQGGPKGKPLMGPAKRAPCRRREPLRLPGEALYQPLSPPSQKQVPAMHCLETSP